VTSQFVVLFAVEVLPPALLRFLIWHIVYWSHATA